MYIVKFIDRNMSIYIISMTMQLYQTCKSKILTSSASSEHQPQQPDDLHMITAKYESDSLDLY